MKKKTVIAYYLPQFHEIEENNIWWGKGFTEWTSIREAKTYFKDQVVRKPSDLGYYDLTDAKVIESQYRIASDYGVDAFCFWTYWFGNNDKILEKPMDLVLKNNLNIKYCIAWANHSWFNKAKGILLKEQKYLGKEDYISFFEYMLPHLKSPNYIKNNNKPVVVIFNPREIPDLDVFISTWNEKALEHEFDGIHFIGEHTRKEDSFISMLDDYLNSNLMYHDRSIMERMWERLVRRHKIKILGPVKFNYSKMIEGLNFKYSENETPVIFSGWDTTIRHKRLGVYFSDFNEVSFQKHVENVFSFSQESTSNFVFLKAWNEWAEGNVLEPDNVFGYKLLSILKNKKYKYSNGN